jgi:hypothetical protein
MNIYLDESYDNDKTVLIVGAVFDRFSSDLNKSFRFLKTEDHFETPTRGLRELKYNKVNDDRKLRLSKSALDSFKTANCYFRGTVVFTKPNAGFNLNRYGRPWEPQNIKMARLYKKLAESTVMWNIDEARLEPIYNLWLDRMTRCQGDELVRILTEEYGPYGRKSATFSQVREVDSKDESHHLIQITDLLCGCILNDHFPTKTVFKNQLREYLCSILNIQGLGKGYWGKNQQPHIPWKIKEKFRITYYEWEK